ncbi:uncharacterized protein LOC116846993 isoform X2 [Odontomachus brunneus]|uniref:uncharacterized protein LOC116846993 isoform X2 n=1 Tax=Odontomachus brunneus TaxID=486640 RepID=UPI0013F1FD8D|nr:uncharacterized protein LOC116846993 isoform X2 [Odontomachus brunneus]
MACAYNLDEIIGRKFPRLLLSALLTLHIQLDICEQAVTARLPRDKIRITLLMSATPLLCETKSWATRSRSVSNVEPSASPWVRVPWPRLKCCNSHDYCNAADGSDASTWTPERRKVMDPARSAVGLGTPENGVSTSRDTMPTIQQGVRQHEDSAELTGDRLLRNRVKALHVAALVLAVAALISVLASCYVVTRFLRSNRYTMNNVN